MEQVLNEFKAEKVSENVSNELGELTIVYSNCGN